MGDTTNPNGITRTFSGLIPHFQIRLQATLYKIDSWNSNTFFIQADGTTIYASTFDSTNGGTTDFCGNPSPTPNSVDTNFNDLIVSVDVSFSHTASSLVIRMVSNLVSASGAWGLRDLNITM